MMKVQLITEKGGAPRELEVPHGTPIGEICKWVQEDLPYIVVAAKADNRLVDLEYQVIRNCTIELVDISSQAGNLIYQYSLSFVFLKAVRDVLGNVECEIENAQNKGLYITLQMKGRPKEEQVRRIEARMWEMVVEDTPFLIRRIPRDEYLAWTREDGRDELTRLIEGAREADEIFRYEIDGYKDMFYGLLTPSAGYLKIFELRKYRGGVLLRFPQTNSPDRIPPYRDEKKMFYAFEEQSEWDDILGIHYLADLNDAIAEGRERELIQLSEALHEKKVAEIADLIKKEHKRIVLIAGPSSSGKTTFARRLCIQLAVNGLRPMYMGTDDYFVEREDTPLDEKGEPDYENLSAIDIELFNDNMNALLGGEEVDMPTFNFLTGHKEFGKRLTRIDEDQLIVIEGIHALNERLTEFIPKDEKFKIYISPLTQLNIDAHNRISTTDERMLRRMVRDYLYRGHDAAETIRNWPKVRRGEDKNIFPFSGEADVLFNSYHVYEISVLRKYAYPLLRKIKRDQPEYTDAQRMLQFLAFFNPIENDSIIVNNSILREFIGGSVFVD